MEYGSNIIRQGIPSFQAFPFKKRQFKIPRTKIDGDDAVKEEKVITCNKISDFAMIFNLYWKELV